MEQKNPGVIYSDEVNIELKISFKGVRWNKKNYREKNNWKILWGYKIYKYNLFVFIFDMNNFKVFEIVIKYYNN